MAAPCIAMAQDSLRLSALHAEALRLDPRQRQIALQSRATDLRIAKIDAERRPSIALDGQAQYQSAVTKFPGQLPTAAFPVPPHNTYDAHLGAQQTLFDPTAAPRKAVERAQLLESQAQTNTSLFSLKQEIDEAFFTAAMIEQRVAEIETAVTDLNARLRETVIRFKEGAALPGDTAAIAATLLQRRQDVLQMRADRSAALARLSELIGRTVKADEALSVGDYSAAVGSALRALDTLKLRPEYAQFSAARDRLAKQTAMIAAQEKPRLSAYGRVGYGRPGLDLLSRDFQSYWIAGLQVHWAPWTWGNTDRDREIAGVQQEIVATNEAAFTRGLNRGIQQSIATIARLDSTLALDEQIIALRERIDRETRAKLREGVVTAAEYVDKSTDVLAARLARVQHRVELAHARATLLTTLGVEVP
jgi:outer membrane protein TolC